MISWSRDLVITFPLFLLAGCAPRVATSFWRIGTPADSTREGYTVLYEGKKARHCYPISEWHDTLPSLQGGVGGRLDTYHSLHHHGVAVESELMAYRIYFDKKQTIDPYCKRKPQLELGQSYWYPKDSLLSLGYGDDILRVSGTVGVGSVKYWLSPLHGGTKGGLVHIENISERSQRIVSQNKNQATIEVAVKGWKVEGKSVEMATRYTMKAGHRDLRCDVLLSDTLSGLCTGVQTIPAKGGKDTISIILPNGILLASWGTDWPVNDSAKYAKETVGLAVFIPHPYAGVLVHDKRNSLCLLHTLPLNPQTGETANYHCHFYLTCCGATKENHPVATTAEEWFAYLRRWAKHLK